MLPALRGLLQQMSRAPIFGSKFYVTREEDNDLLNDRTIESYMTQAFSTVDVEKEYRELKEKRGIRRNDVSSKFTANDYIQESSLPVTLTN